MGEKEEDRNNNNNSNSMSTLTSRDLCVERSTTRLHAPPGGRSSFSLAHDEGMEKQNFSTPSKEVAYNQDQKIDLSTSPGDTSSDSSTLHANKRVRVMQPPGGYSSFTLG